MMIDRRPNQALGGKRSETSIGHYKPTNRYLLLESGIERMGFDIMSADRSIIDIRGQRPVLSYFLGGVWHETYVDFLYTKTSAQRVGVIVKPSFEKAVAEAMRDAIKATSPEWRDYMSDIVVRTEVDFNEAAAWNAAQILIERENFDEEEYARAARDISRIDGRVRFHDLLLQGRSMADRRTALWNAVDRGVLRQAEGGRIEDTTFVQFTGKLGD